jgi:prepilin-type N-terminal cleavage/methylation domain-containing protein/prepilin-type processing-associated H-X9-DG protein
MVNLRWVSQPNRPSSYHACQAPVSVTRSAFTLLELLVVIGIIATLMALVVPAVQKVREAANRMHCGSNLRQLAMAVHTYEAAHKRFPYGTVGPYKPVAGQPNYGWGPDSRGWSWLARLLPYVEESNLYQQGGIPLKTLRQSGICDKRVALFLCPSDTAYNAPPRLDAGNLAGFPVGHTNYKGVSGANWGEDKGEGKTLNTIYKNRGANGSWDGLIEGDGAMFRADERARINLLAIHDGTSSTFLIGEDVPERNLWCSWPYANNAYGTCAVPPNVRKPDGTYYNPLFWHYTWSFRSSHPNGLQFAFADGSVRFIRSDINLAAYRALATIRGTEAIDVRQFE